MISEFPLFAFTTLGGAAAGAYGMAALFGYGRESKRLWLFPLVCIVVLGVGLLGVLGHLKRPELFYLALANPSAMICQEAYWSIALGLLVLVDFATALAKKRTYAPVRILAAIAACGLMFIMANAYFTAYTNDAWSNGGTFLLFVVGDIVIGAALYLVLNEAERIEKRVAYTVAVAAALFAASMIVVGAHFGSTGYSGAPFFAAAVLAAGAAAAQAASCRKALSANLALWIVVALSLVSVVVARYCFYAVSTL